MSYDIVNNGIKGIVTALGFAPSQYSSIDSVPSEEVGNTFLLTPISGQNDEKSSETLSLLYDIQIWELQIAFQKSNQNQSINFDEINRKRDQLIREIDDPANWESYVRIQKYLNWRIEEKKNFYLLTMQIKIIDTITY
jgi:hypothetical protein